MCQQAGLVEEVANFLLHLEDHSVAHHRLLLPHQGTPLAAAARRRLLSLNLPSLHLGSSQLEHPVARSRWAPIRRLLAAHDSVREQTARRIAGPVGLTHVLDWRQC